MNSEGQFSVWVADIANQLPLYHKGTYDSPEEAHDVAIVEVTNWNKVRGVKYSEAVVSIWGGPEEPMVLVTPYPQPRDEESPVGAILSGVEIPEDEP